MTIQNSSFRQITIRDSSQITLENVKIMGNRGSSFTGYENTSQLFMERSGITINNSIILNSKLFAINSDLYFLQNVIAMASDQNIGEEDSFIFVDFTWIENIFLSVNTQSNSPTYSLYTGSKINRWFECSYSPADLRDNIFINTVIYQHSDENVRLWSNYFLRSIWDNLYATYEVAMMEFTNNHVNDSIISLSGFSVVYLRENYILNSSIAMNYYSYDGDKTPNSLTDMEDRGWFRVIDNHIHQTSITLGHAGLATISGNYITDVPTAFWLYNIGTVKIANNVIWKVGIVIGHQSKMKADIEFSHNTLVKVVLIDDRGMFKRWWNYHFPLFFRIVQILLIVSWVLIYYKGYLQKQYLKNQ